MTRVRSGRTTRVRDARGAGGRAGGLGGLGGLGGVGGRSGIPGGARIGGGLLGVVLLVALVVLPQLVGSSGSTSTPVADSGETVCDSEIEAIVCGAVDDVSEFWEQQYSVTFQGAYQGTDTVFFSGSIDSACGRTPASVGPFYCPADRLVYFDLDALEGLQRELGAGGDLAAQYIVAHEYGHHIQTITGIRDASTIATQRGELSPNDLSVRLELQADCFAGTWAKSVADRGLFDQPEEIDEALNAAAAVGDDRLQADAGMSVDPETFTHGSAAQRRAWFQTGFRSGDPAACTTFDGQLAPQP
jgi:predicted metalloprotease